MIIGVLLFCSDICYFSFASVYYISNLHVSCVQIVLCIYVHLCMMYVFMILMLRILFVCINHCHCILNE